MTHRHFHRLIGLLLTLPMLGWAATGAVFLIKPGYTAAYDSLAVKTYPIGATVNVSLPQHSGEIRLLNSILGSHLFVSNGSGSLHYDPLTQALFPLPSRSAVKRLVNDAIQANPLRYGEVREVNGLVATTTTNVRIELDWDTLTFTQYGNDRAIIDTLYKIHYLQWTPWPLVNRWLGVLGLAMLLSLTALGVAIYIKSRR